MQGVSEAIATLFARRKNIDAMQPNQVIAMVFQLKGLSAQDHSNE
ncbi:hypothetical protein PMIT1303_00997 [Prochlorococcus sp. MIT 1303]|nr:hypothetical protein PMIT1303_00997 [Prochlorococcus sp. MIT 1303]